MCATESLEVLPVEPEIVWRHHVDRSGEVCTIRLSGDLDLAAKDDLRRILDDELRRPGGRPGHRQEPSGVLSEPACGGYRCGDLLWLRFAAEEGA